MIVLLKLAYYSIGDRLPPQPPPSLWKKGVNFHSNCLASPVPDTALFQAVELLPMVLEKK